MLEIYAIIPSNFRRQEDFPNSDSIKLFGVSVNEVLTIRLSNSTFLGLANH